MDAGMDTCAHKKPINSSRNRTNAQPMSPTVVGMMKCTFGNLTIFNELTRRIVTAARARRERKANSYIPLRRVTISS